MATLRRRRNRPVRVKKQPPKSDAFMEGTVFDGQVTTADHGQKILEHLKDGGKHVPSISHYEFVEPLGEGGMGTVFLADHVSEGGIRKQVAIKILKDVTDRKALDSFVREAQLLSKLSQGTVVELLSLESLESGKPKTNLPPAAKKAKARKLLFMVMEYVNGPSLEDVVQDHAENVLLMHPAMVGFVLNKSVIALAEAHMLTDDFENPAGLAHRDISPSNILFYEKAGITKLADFGVATAFGREREGARTLVGKPRYMAPEAMEGLAGAPSDIWSLGVIGYEALTGFAPYRPLGRTTRERIDSLKKQLAHPLRAPHEILKADMGERFELAALSEILMRCLRQDPAKRPTAPELNHLLEGSFLYNKGLGPTNKTLAAYLHLLGCAIGDGEVIPPPDYGGSEDAKTLCATLWVEEPVQVFRRRARSCYHADFVDAVKARAVNPCLRPLNGTPFSP